jgi:hypothetical protein
MSDRQFLYIFTTIIAEILLVPIGLLLGDVLTAVIIGLLVVPIMNAFGLFLWFASG